MTNKKTVKPVGAKASKRRDYGDPVKQKFDAPYGAMESTGGRHITFTQFGNFIEGFFDMVEVKKGKGKSDILHFHNLDGAACTAFMSYHLMQHITSSELQSGDYFKAVFIALLEGGRGGRRMKEFKFWFIHNAELPDELKAKLPTKPAKPIKTK